MSFLKFHFLTFAIVSEFSTAVGDFRLQTPENGLLWHAWFSVLRIPVWLIAFRLTLKLREQAAQLAEKEVKNCLGAQLGIRQLHSLFDCASSSKLDIDSTITATQF